MTYPHTDGTDEGFENQLARTTPEEAQAFLQAYVAAQIEAQTAPLLARIREAESKAGGGVLSRANTSRRENGGMRRFSLNGKAFQSLEQTLVQISGEANAEPRILSVSLSKTNLTTPPVGSNHVVYARIRWGAGKNKNEVLIDYKQGARVTVDGSSVEVSGIMTATAGPIVAPDIELGAQVIEGSLGAQKATFTSTPVLVTGGGTFSPVLLIPKFATSVSVYGSTAGPYAILQRKGSGGGDSIIQSTGANQQLGLLNGMEFVQVRNDNAVDDTIFVVFELNF